MRKIPTLFVRDPEDMRYVTRDVHPDCRWVLDGEGVATRKYDGTCVLLEDGEWWARREVKPGKQPPPAYRPLQTDPNTGKTVGWEPVGQSSFAKVFATVDTGGLAPGTYELAGPKINGNPEHVTENRLIRHGHMSTKDTEAVRELKPDFDSLRDWLRAHDWEGLVWHGPDGRMAKLKAKDFPRDF